MFPIVKNLYEFKIRTIVSFLLLINRKHIFHGFIFESKAIIQILFSEKNIICYTKQYTILR